MQQHRTQLLRALRFVGGLRVDIFVQETLLAESAEKIEYLVCDLGRIGNVANREAEQRVAQTGQEKLQGHAANDRRRQGAPQKSVVGDRSYVTGVKQNVDFDRQAALVDGPARERSDDRILHQKRFDALAAEAEHDCPLKMTYSGDALAESLIGHRDVVVAGRVEAIHRDGFCQRLGGEPMVAGRLIYDSKNIQRLGMLGSTRQYLFASDFRVDDPPLLVGEGRFGRQRGNVGWRGRHHSLAARQSGAPISPVHPAIAQFMLG